MKRLLCLLGIVALQLAVVAPAANARTDSGYWMLAENGAVYGFGGAVQMGQPGSASGKAIDIAATPSGDGYWVVSENATSNYGDAPDLRDFTFLNPGETVVSISASPSGKGYWLFSNQGRVFPRGDAVSYGDMAGTTLNSPVLDSVATPSGRGYWMVAGDGGVFSFGDAKFYGSMGGKPLNKPVKALAPDPDGVGYWLVASDGGIFAFDAGFFGSMGGTRLNKPVSAMVGQPGGYLMVGEDGGIFAFGTVAFKGSLGANPPASRVVSVAAIGLPPVYDWVTVAESSGTSDNDSAPFTLSGAVAELSYNCGSTGAFGFGCNFVVYNYGTGSQLDYASADPNVPGKVILHPTAGQYYVQSHEYNDVTNWSWSIRQQVCVQNCG